MNIEAEKDITRFKILVGFLGATAIAAVFAAIGYRSGRKNTAKVVKSLIEANGKYKIHAVHEVVEATEEEIKILQEQGYIVEVFMRGPAMKPRRRGRCSTLVHQY